MKSRIAILVSVTALSLAPAMAAQSGPQALAFASRPEGTEQTSQQRGQGSRHILEFVADRLDFSEQQKSQLRTLIERQQQMVSALHQNNSLDDQQKQQESEQIRQQTKEQFIAMLTPEQRRQFGWMSRQPRQAQQVQYPTSNSSQTSGSHSAREIDQVLNSVQSDNATPVTGGQSPR